MTVVCFVNTGMQAAVTATYTTIAVRYSHKLVPIAPISQAIYMRNGSAAVNKQVCFVNTA